MSDQIAQSVASLGEEEAIRAILAEVCAITGMGFSAVAYVSEDRWIACQVDDRIQFGLEPGEELEVRKTICDEIRRDGEAIMIDDTDADHDWWSHPVPVLYGFHSYVSLPITLDDGAFFGTLCAIDPEPRPEPIRRRLDRLEELARQVASIIGSRLTESAPARDAIPLTRSRQPTAQ